MLRVTCVASRFRPAILGASSQHSCIITGESTASPRYSAWSVQRRGKKRLRMEKGVIDQKLPFSPGTPNEDPTKKYHRDTIWEQAAEDIKLQSDPLLSQNLEEALDSSLFKDLELDMPESGSGQAVEKLESQLADFPTLTVSEDFNARQKKQGNYGGDSFNDVRATYNRSERASGFPSVSMRNEPASLVSTFIGAKRDPSEAFIAYMLKTSPPHKNAVALEKQFYSIAKELNETDPGPEIAKLVEESEKTVVQFDVDPAIKKDENLKKLRGAVHLEDPNEDDDQFKTSEDGQEDAEADNSSEATKDAQEEDEAIPNTIYHANGYEAFVENKNKVYTMQTFKKHTIRTSTSLEKNELPFQLRDTYGNEEKEDIFVAPYFPINDGSKCLQDYKLHKEPLEPEELPDPSTVQEIESFEPLDYTSLSRKDPCYVENDPFIPDANASALDFGSADNIGNTERATREHAKLIKEALISEGLSESQVTEELLAKRTGGYKNDPLSCLDNLDPVQDLAASLEAEEKEQEMTPEEDVDSVDELERILKDDTNKRKDEDYREGIIREKKDKYRLPPYKDLNIEKVISNGGSTKDIQNALQAYLLDGTVELENDDVPFSQQPQNDGIIPSAVFLEKVKKAYGDNPPIDVYNEGIMSYLKSEHLRDAMHLLKDMKRHDYVASEEAYTGIVEGFYSNFDITGGDAFAAEMKRMYPNSTPPSLEVMNDDDDSYATASQ